MSESSRTSDSPASGEPPPGKHLGLIPPEVLARETLGDRLLKVAMLGPHVILGYVSGAVAVVATVLGVIALVDQKWGSPWWYFVVAFVGVLSLGASRVDAQIERSYLDGRRERRNIATARPPEGDEKE